jgi:hypothetical protein
MKKYPTDWLAGVGTPNIAKKLYVQNIYKTGGVKFSSIKQLKYENGKLKTDKKIKLTGLKWLYGFNIADFDSDGKEEVIYTTHSDKIRLQKKKRKHHIDSADLFGKTPHFIDLNGRTLFFYPTPAIFENRKGEFSVYGIENKKKGGILARAMGQYEYAIMHKLKWTQSIFEQVGSFKLPGYIYDMTDGKFADFEKGIILPCITLDEKTIIKILNY